MGARPATYDDVLAAPEHQVAELIDGELYLSGRPAPPHAWTAMQIGADLTMRHGRPHDGEPAGWVLLPEPELWLGPEGDVRATVLVPDLAGWRVERLPSLPDTVGFTTTPDWVAEVLSPSTVRHDRIRKLAIYASRGIPYAWLVDPLAHTVEVFALRDGVYALVGAEAGDGEVVLPPFDEAALPIGAWWARSHRDADRG